MTKKMAFAFPEKQLRNSPTLLPSQSDCQTTDTGMAKEKTVKGEDIPLKAWTGPEGSRRLRLPDFMTTAQDGGKVVSPTHRPPLPPRKYS